MIAQINKLLLNKRKLSKLTSYNRVKKLIGSKEHKVYAAQLFFWRY